MRLSPISRMAVLYSHSTTTAPSPSLLNTEAKTCCKSQPRWQFIPAGTYSSRVLSETILELSRLTLFPIQSTSVQALLTTASRNFGSLLTLPPRSRPTAVRKSAWVDIRLISRLGTPAQQTFTSPPLPGRTRQAATVQTPFPRALHVSCTPQPVPSQ